MSHAYLFAGPRGTGKTSTAKILAMALNCEAGGGQGHRRRPTAPAPTAQAIRRGSFHGRARDRRRLQPRHRRDPRDPRPGAVRAGRRAHEGLHRRRSPHADPGGLQRPAQDARGATAARGLRAGHHRAAPGAPHHPVPLPALRLPPPRHCRRSCGCWSSVAEREGIEVSREHPVGHRPGGRRAASATPSAPSTSCPPTARARSRCRTRWPSWAWPSRTSCSSWSTSSTTRDTPGGPAVRGAADRRAAPTSTSS